MNIFFTLAAGELPPDEQLEATLAELCEELHSGDCHRLQGTWRQHQSVGVTAGLRDPQRRFRHAGRDSAGAVPVTPRGVPQDTHENEKMG